MIAALPMYDRPETAAAHDALWALIRAAHGGDLPETLDRSLSPEATWSHPGLVLGQICGQPFRERFRSSVRLVGTPDYGLPDTRPGYYRSVVVCRADDTRENFPDFAGGTFAFNDVGSHSGWTAPMRAAADVGIAFAATRRTGAHRESACAVADGRADLAGIDAVAWRSISRFDVSARRLRVVAVTGESPGLPFVAAPTFPTEPMRDAVTRAVAALDPRDRDILGVCGVVQINPDEYLRA